MSQSERDPSNLHILYVENRHDTGGKNNYGNVPKYRNPLEKAFWRSNMFMIVVIATLWFLLPVALESQLELQKKIMTIGYYVWAGANLSTFLGMMMINAVQRAKQQRGSLNDR